MPRAVTVCVISLLACVATATLECASVTAGRSVYKCGAQLHSMPAAHGLESVLTLTFGPLSEEEVQTWVSGMTSVHLMPLVVADLSEITAPLALHCNTDTHDSNVVAICKLTARLPLGAGDIVSADVELRQPGADLRRFLGTVSNTKTASVTYTASTSKTRSVTVWTTRTPTKSRGSLTKTPSVSITPTNSFTSSLTRSADPSPPPPVTSTPTATISDSPPPLPSNTATTSPSLGSPEAAAASSQAALPAPSIIGIVVGVVGGVMVIAFAVFVVLRKRKGKAKKKDTRPPPPPKGTVIPPVKPTSPDAQKHPVTEAPKRRFSAFSQVSKPELPELPEPLEAMSPGVNRFGPESGYPAPNVSAKPVPTRVLDLRRTSSAPETTIVTVTGDTDGYDSEEQEEKALASPVQQLQHKSGNRDRRRSGGREEGHSRKLESFLHQLKAMYAHRPRRRRHSAERERRRDREYEREHRYDRGGYRSRPRQEEPHRARRRSYSPANRRRRESEPAGAGRHRDVLDRIVTAGGPREARTTAAVAEVRWPPVGTENVEPQPASAPLEGEEGGLQAHLAKETERFRIRKYHTAQQALVKAKQEEALALMELKAELAAHPPAGRLEAPVAARVPAPALPSPSALPLPVGNSGAPLQSLPLPAHLPSARPGPVPVPAALGPYPVPSLQTSAGLVPMRWILVPEDVVDPWDAVVPPMAGPGYPPGPVPPTPRRLPPSGPSQLAQQPLPINGGRVVPTWLTAPITPGKISPARRNSQMFY